MSTNVSTNINTNLNPKPQVPFQIQFELTPNPECMKFNLGMQINQTPFECKNSIEAENSPLAAKLFGFPWTSGVFVGTDFITVTKQDWVEWAVLAEPLSTLIKEHLERGEAIVVNLHSDSSTGIKGGLPPNNLNPNDQINPSDSPLVVGVKRLLNNEIRPAVAYDGGDIHYSHIENDILYIRMKGACSGCPSSQITLKEGIESRVREVFPSIKEVVSI
jgi:Fe-S cluster biogenesis protein NfuA